MPNFLAIRIKEKTNLRKRQKQRMQKIQMKLSKVVRSAESILICVGELSKHDPSDYEKSKR